MIVNHKKKKELTEKLTLPSLADYRVKLKESQKGDKYLDLASKLKKTTEHEVDGDSNCNWYIRYSHQKINKGTGRLGNTRTNTDHPNDSIVESGQNNEKNFRDLKKLAVTQTPVENNRLMLM